MTSRRSLTTLFTALGLALLLVVGAWSTSHGEADVHASLCLAAGASGASGASAADAGTGASHHDEVAPLDSSSSPGSSSPVALTTFVVLSFLALLGLLVRAMRRDRGVLLPRTILSVTIPRVGPRPPRGPLTLTELSISRT